MLERESVCNIDLDTEPRSKKTGTRQDRYITKQQKPVCCCRPAQVFIAWLSRKCCYNKSVETQDGCHYTYVTQDTRSVASASVSRLFGADGSLLLIIPKSIPYLNDNPGNRYDPEQILKTDMYHLPRNRFPAGATIHAILSAHAGGQATVLLTVIRWVST